MPTTNDDDVAVMPQQVVEPDPPSFLSQSLPYLLGQEGAESAQKALNVFRRVRTGQPVARSIYEEELPNISTGFPFRHVPVEERGKQLGAWENLILSGATFALPGPKGAGAAEAEMGAVMRRAAETAGRAISEHGDIAQTNIGRLMDSLGKGGSLETNAARLRNALPQGRQHPDDLQQMGHGVAFFRDRLLAMGRAALKQPWARQASKQYQGYHTYATKIADEFGHKPETAMLAESALSPNNSPDQSFEATRRLMKMLRDNPDDRFDAKMSDWARNATWISPEKGRLNLYSDQDIADLAGKKFSELPKNNVLQAQWLRAFDEAYHPDRTLRVVRPDGTLGDFVKSSTGKQFPFAWTPFKMMQSGIDALQGTRTADEILSSPKVSNYYMSKLLAFQPSRHVVVDTHHTSAAWGNSMPASHELIRSVFPAQRVGPNAEFGGYYSIIHEATLQAADKLGMDPKEFQAMIWSYQRGFRSPDAFGKSSIGKASVKDIQNLWKDAAQGKISEQEANKRAEQIAIKHHKGKVPEPGYFGSGGEEAPLPGTSGKPAELPTGGGVRGGTGSGVGGDVTSGTAIESGTPVGYQQGGEVTDGPGPGDEVIQPDEGPGPDDEVIPPDQPNHVPVQRSFTGGSGRNVNLAFEGYQAAGASPVAAAALLGDSDQESGFRPDLPGDNQTSWGLHQVGSTMYRQFLTAQKTFGIDSSTPDYVRNQAAFIANRFRHMNPQRWAAMNSAPDAASALRIFRSTPGWNYGRAGNRYQYAQQYEGLMSFVPGKGVPDQDVDQNLVPGPDDEIILPDKGAHAGAQASRDIREAHDKGDVSPNKARKLLRQAGDPTPDHLAPTKDVNIEEQNKQRKKQGLPPLEELKQAPPPAFHGGESHNEYVKKLDDWRDWIEGQFGPSSTTLPIEAETGGKTPPGLLGSPETPFPINPKSGAAINTLKLAGDVTNSLMQGATTPDAIMSIGIFSLPYVPQAYLLDVAAHVPDQYIEMRDRLKKQGMTWENASRIAQTAVGDVLALLPFAAKKYLKSKGELGRGGDIYAKKPDQTPSSVSAEQRVPAEPQAEGQVPAGDPRDEAPLKTQGTFVPPFVDPETGFTHYRAGEFRSGVEGITLRFPGAAEKPPETAKPVAPPALSYDKDGNLIQEDGKVVQMAPSVKASTNPGGIANRYLQEAIDRGELPENIMVKRGGQTREQSMLEGRDWINKGGDPRLVAARLARGGAASRPELNGIHAEYDRLRQVVRQLDDDAQSRPDDAALRERLRIARGARDDFLRNILPVSKAFASDALKTLQGMHPVDAETFSGLEELFKEHNGVTEINDSTRKALRARSNGARKLADKENVARKALDAAVDRAFPDVNTPSPEQMREIVNKMVADLTPCK